MACGAGLLGILGDWVPFGIGQALGQRAGGNSLDNTLRLVRLVPTEWVLLDVRIHGIANGFGHGLVHLWSEDGTLLATASQSVIVRYWDDNRRRPAGSA
jgi:acyl-CoA thioesterase